MENVITLGKLIGYFCFFLCPPPLSFVFEDSENKRNDLARPVMGTIFLVIIASFSLKQYVQVQEISCECSDK